MADREGYEVRATSPKGREAQCLYRKPSSLYVQHRYDSFFSYCHILSAPFPRPGIVDPVPMLGVFVLLGNYGPEAADELLIGAAAELLVFSQHSQRPAAVGVGVKVQIQLLEGEVVLADLPQEHLTLSHFWPPPLMKG